MKKYLIIGMLCIIALSGCVSYNRYGLISTKPFISNAKYVQVTAKKNFVEMEYIILGVRVNKPTSCINVLSNSLDNEKGDFFKETELYSNGQSFSLGDLEIFAVNTYTVNGEVWKIDGESPTENRTKQITPEIITAPLVTTQAVEIKVSEKNKKLEAKKIGKKGAKK